MKFKKIDKEYLLTDDTVNCYGFRLLTDGYQIDEFKKNPIGYLMHDRDSGVLLKWEDLRTDGDKVYGKPVINMSHARGQQTVDEVENGFLNAASVGHLVVLEFSDDPTMKLPNQTGPTVTKWYNRECSLVDVPGNFNALALYDSQDNLINLADFTKPKLPMKQLVISAAMLSALNLSADSDDNKVSAAFNDLVAKAAKADGLQVELNNLKAEVAADKKKNGKKEIDSHIAAGLAGKKITKELGEKLAKDYENNPEGLKDLIDSMPTYSPITSQLGGEDPNWGADLAAKSWDDIWKSGKAPELKAKNPELYKKKFKEQFGTEPK